MTREHMVVVTHRAACVTVVKNPSERLGQVVTRVDHTGDMPHDDLTVLTPRLNRKELHFNVTCPGSRLLVVDDVDAGLVIHMHRARIGNLEAQVL